MTAEIDLFGVFINAALASAILAALVHFPVRRLLARAGFYQRVWHPNLADLALYCILWGAASFALSAIGNSSIFLS